MSYELCKFVAAPQLIIPNPPSTPSNPSQTISKVFIIDRYVKPINLQFVWTDLKTTLVEGRI